MKYSKNINKAIQSAAKHYLKSMQSGTKEYMNILRTYNNSYGQIFPNNDWSNINDDWVENWSNKTFINLLNHKNNDIELLQYLHDLRGALQPGIVNNFDDPSGELVFELLDIPLRLDDPNRYDYNSNEIVENKIKAHKFNENIFRVGRENFSIDEAKIINSIKKNNFNISIKMYNNNITDRNKYPYNLGKINNYLIEYCQNNNLNIIFVGTGTDYFNGLGRYKRFAELTHRYARDFRLEQTANLGLELLSDINRISKKDNSAIKRIDYINESDFTGKPRLERENYYPDYYKMIGTDYSKYKDSTPPNFLSPSDNNAQAFESHLYAPFENTFFEYINKLWGELFEDSDRNPILQYYNEEMEVGVYDSRLDDVPRVPDQVYDIDLAWKKKMELAWGQYDPDNSSIPEEIHEQARNPKYTKQDFIKEHKKLNKDNLEWIKFSAKVLLPITYTCNMGVNGAEFDLTNLEVLFKNKILNKSKTLIVVENNGFKNNDFVTKTSSFPNRIIFNTGDIARNENIKLNMNYKTEFANTNVPVSKTALPLYNYFLPILTVLLELSPYTQDIGINSSLLSNKVIKNIVATHLVNFDSNYFDPNPKDINMFQNFERNFNSTIYILRKSGYIEQKGNLVITEDAIKKLRKFIEKPNIYPIVITHSNNRTKYLIGKNNYWSTSEQIENKLSAGQIEKFKQLSKGEEYDKTVINFIKSFLELNKFITLTGEDEKNNLDITYTNNSMAILEINNDH